MKKNRQPTARRYPISFLLTLILIAFLGTAEAQTITNIAVNLVKGDQKDPDVVMVTNRTTKVGEALVGRVAEFVQYSSLTDIDIFF